MKSIGVEFWQKFLTWLYQLNQIQERKRSKGSMNRPKLKKITVGAKLSSIVSAKGQKLP